MRGRWENSNGVSKSCAGRKKEDINAVHFTCRTHKENKYSALLCQIIELFYNMKHSQSIKRCCNLHWQREELATLCKPHRRWRQGFATCHVPHEGGFERVRGRWVEVVLIFLGRRRKHLLTTNLSWFRGPECWPHVLLVEGQSAGVCVTGFSTPSSVCVCLCACLCIHIPVCVWQHARFCAHVWMYITVFQWYYQYVCDLIIKI